MSPDEPVTYDAMTDVIHPDDRERVFAEIEAAQHPQGSGDFATEHRIVRPDGEVRWIHVRGRSCYEGEGSSRRAVRGIAVLQDITARKLAELALADSEEIGRAAGREGVWQEGE